MSDSRPEPTPEPRRRGRRVLLVLLMGAFMGLFWLLTLGSTAALFYAFGWREGVLMAGGLIVLTGILAEFRVSGFDMVFDWICSIGEMILEVIATIVSGILGIFGLSWRD